MRKKIFLIFLILFLSSASSDSSDSYEDIEESTTVSSKTKTDSLSIKGYFIVTANRLLRPNKPYRVSIQYQEYENETVLSVGIKNRSFEVYQNVTLLGTDSKTVEFLVSKNLDSN